jgi:hypothetical protein
LDSGYEIGIITASDRSIRDICGVNNEPFNTWMSPLLCRYLNSNGFYMYNSYTLTAGADIPFPNFGNDTSRSTGRKKGWQMKVGGWMLGIDQENVFLFDDNIDVIEGAHDENRRGNFIYVDNDTDMFALSIERVKDIII